MTRVELNSILVLSRTAQYHKVDAFSKRKRNRNGQTKAAQTWIKICFFKHVADMTWYFSRFRTFSLKTWLTLSPLKSMASFGLGLTHTHRSSFVLRQIEIEHSSNTLRTEERVFWQFPAFGWRSKSGSFELKSRFELKNAIICVFENCGSKIKFQTCDNWKTFYCPKAAFTLRRSLLRKPPSAMMSVERI